MKRLMTCVSLCAVLPLVLLAQGTTGQASLKKVRVNGVELHYVDQGNGVPVVFIHGGLEDYRAWQGQVESFSTRYRAIAYSRRYNYPNVRVVSESRYSPIVDADDLAVLITKLGLAPSHIVAHSYGAYVALFLAARHPELVRSLALSEPPVLPWLREMEGGPALFTEFMSKVWEPAARGFREQDEAGVKAALDGFGELGYSGTDQKMTFATLPPEARSVLLENAPEWRVLTMSKGAFPALPLSTIKRIKAPTLLLSGQRSLKLANLIDRRLEGLLQAQRIILANATHDMWDEYPEACRNAVLAFFARH